MRRYEIWVDNDNKLVLSEFGNLNSENERRIFRGAQTYNTIKLLSTKEITDIYEQDNYISIKFENYIININEIDKVLEKREISPLVNIVKKYFEVQSLKQRQKKKVTRKNKYIGKKILAIGTGLLIIATTAAALNNNVQATDNITLSYEQDIGVKHVEENLDITNTSVSEVILSNIDSEELINVSINYDDRSDTNKAYVTRAYYSDLIEKYASRYGLDSKLVTAIATQERGVHGTTIDTGGAIGLMQIQYDIWVNEQISAYNFETGQREIFVVDKEKLPDIDYNIKVGCMYLQNCMESMNYNTVAAVQAYNLGCGSMKKILKAYSSDCGRSVNEILSDMSDTGWLEYRNIINMGDPDYVENVFSYLGGDSYIKNVKKDGTIVTIGVNNQMSSKKIY